MAAMPASTESCQYQTGKTLGNGTYAIVKEAIHIETGKRYACKVINKRLMHGREYMVRNEIDVLKRISSGNSNIVTLHDYFETPHSVYLCFDLCTGGELFDRICGKGNYYEKYGLPYCEPDAADLVRTILTAVALIHSAGIVHGDIKPENLLFRTPAEDADIMIADFGLSRFMDGEKLSQLTEVCGTHGYMAPEIFLQSVVTYALLVGYTPFDRDTPQAEMEAVIAGDYSFDPEEPWADVSGTARDFITACLTLDPEKRPTVQQALEHKWLASATPHFVPSPTGGPTDLLRHVKKVFDAQHPCMWRELSPPSLPSSSCSPYRVGYPSCTYLSFYMTFLMFPPMLTRPPPPTGKKAAFSSNALHQIEPNTAHPLGKEAQKFSDDLRKYKEESEQEVLEVSVVHLITYFSSVGGVFSPRAGAGSPLPMAFPGLASHGRVCAAHRYIFPHIPS
ncbi:Protein kinase domain-containing protein [Mycena kentingensis (nom. inval.)]|nr:Protein kinase domain-containing protein [Mycena kentingensis (nom. inval.)]